MKSEVTIHHGRNATTVELSRTGSEVLIVENLATASLVNPEREADQWANSQLKRFAGLGDHETIVILGVASAFHIRAVMQMLAEYRSSYAGRIVALDTCPHSIAFAKARVANVTFLQIDTAITVEQFVAVAEVADWISDAFTFLKHKPTVSRAGASLRQLESWIVGRTPEAFLAHLRQRPEIAAGLNPARSEKIAETPLVSIRDLSKMWDISSELKNDRRLFRVLEELVR